MHNVSNKYDQLTFIIAPTIEPEASVGSVIMYIRGEYLPGHAVDGDHASTRKIDLLNVLRVSFAAKADKKYVDKEIVVMFIALVDSATLYSYIDTMLELAPGSALSLPAILPDPR